MNNTDLISIIGNLSRSLFPVQHLLSGFAYLIGIVLFITGLLKLKKMGAASGHSQEKIFIPIVFFLGASAFIFLPTALDLLSNTVFGVGNILQYAKYNPYDIYNSMRVIIQTAGLIWFVRGCVLLVHASEPGVKHGSKGLLFLCAGVLAMNFYNTTAVINTFLTSFIGWTMTFKALQGY